MAKQHRQETATTQPTWERLLSKLYLVPEINDASSATRLEMINLLSAADLSVEQLYSRLCVILPKITGTGIAAVIRTDTNQPVPMVASCSNKQLQDLLTNKSISRHLKSNSTKQRISPRIILGNLKIKIGYIQTKVLDKASGTTLICANELPFSSENSQFFEICSQIALLRVAIANLNQTQNAQATQILTLTQHLGEGMATIGPDKKIVFWNRPLERLTGYSAKEVCGVPYETVFFNLDSSNMINSALTRIFNNSKERHFSADLEITAKNDSTRWLNFSGTQHSSKNSTSGSLIILIHDIAKAKQLEQKKNEFISIATHEFRTPLTVIRGYLSLLSRDKESFTNKQSLYIDRATEASDRLVKLAEELLQVVQVEQDRLQIVYKNFQLQSLLKKISRDFKTRAGQKGLNLTFTRPPFPTDVFLDPVRTEQIFANLVDNAIKYTNKGSVKVSFEQTTERSSDKKWILVHIKDTGIGIQGSSVNDVFEKFHRAHRLEKVKEQGAGLGLFIVKSFVEKMGGEISIRSRVNQGTTFTVSFPVAKTKSFARKKSG